CAWEFSSQWPGDVTEARAGGEIQQQRSKVISAGCKTRAQGVDGRSVTLALLVSGRVSEQGSGGTPHRARVLAQQRPEPARPGVSLAVQISVYVDGLAVLLRAIGPDRIELLERQPDVVKEGVTAGARRVLLVSGQAFARRPRTRRHGLVQRRHDA